MMTPSFHLVDFASIVLFVVLLILPGIGYSIFGLKEVVAFKFADVVSGPLRASLADWRGKPFFDLLGVGDERSRSF